MISNYKTHIETELDLKDVNLLIGSNNSGKTNLITGLDYFSRIVSSSLAENNKDNKLYRSNYFSYKHSLSNEDIPICFKCEWEKEGNIIEYVLQIYYIAEEKPSNVGCKEKITLKNHYNTKTFFHGYDEPSHYVLLKTKLGNENLTKDETETINSFFRSLSSLYYYNFQPSFLKGLSVPLIHGEIEEKKSYSDDYLKTGKHPDIAGNLGREGSNFLELVRFIRNYDKHEYDKFIRYLRKFVPSFKGIMVDNHITKWQFDMGANTFPYFESNDVSDGLIKAGAVALLCAMNNPPAIIMLDEIENGINQRNISEFISWIIGVSDNGYNTQFILTTHSPSIIREFSERLDCVYNLYLRLKDYRTVVTNLNDAIKPLANMGRIKEDDIITINGKQVVQVTPYELTELFYDGILSEL